MLAFALIRNLTCHDWLPLDARENGMCERAIFVLCLWQRRVGGRRLTFNNPIWQSQAFTTIN